MKKKIEIYVRACDKCGRTEMELRICMGCGKTLCGFCSHDMGDKYSMATRNRLHAYDGYAMFRNCFKYDFVREEYGDISICIECLVKPDAHHIGTLLKQCNKMGKLISDDAAGMITSLQSQALMIS